MDRSGPSLDLAPRLDTRPGQRLLSFLSLLATSAVELDAALERAVADNPLLERRPWRTCATCGLATAADRCAACASAHWEREPEAEVDWRADLVRDAAAELPRSLRTAVDLVVTALDDHGLLSQPPPLEPDVLAAVVGALRVVGPPGIAARSPVDCVRVQAAGLVAAGSVPAVVAVVADGWLPEVADERYADVAAALGTSVDAVREAVDLLRARTRPYVALPGGTTRSAPTDVVFTVAEPDGPVLAHVADAAAAGLVVVRDLLDALPTGPRDARAEARAWVGPHRDAADRLLAAVAARRHMLQRVADELAVRQRGLLLEGPAAQAPLRRREVAAALDVHPSTVGRVVSGKVARCPDGRLVPLAAFFGATAPTQVRVAAACAARPGATDREVAELLSRTGPPIARRTVAKYRLLAAKDGSPRS